MRSRFFGASSYDDDEDEDELDLSGFVTSSETQPVIVERSRVKKTEGGEGPTEASNMGNAGPRTVPPPMSNMAYAPNFVNSAANNQGSPWNPVWAHDNSLGPNALIVGSKCLGVMGLAAGTAYAAGKRSLKGMPAKVMVGSSALYLHPVLVWNHGQLDKLVGNRGVILNYSSKVVAQAAGAFIFYKLIKRA